jgi:coenzyme F420-reducing hydrogenase alpha subunit
LNAGDPNSRRWWRNMNKMMEINIKPLTRVEGEGEVEIVVENGNVKKIQVEITEAPRFFEAFVKGRKYLEVPDFVARICGICPVPYIYSSSRAMEKILEINIPKEIQTLRKTLLFGEWISSHALHVFLLHAPDFMKLNDVIELAKIKPEIVRKALKLKAFGNYVMEKIGGRSVHPVSCRIGGFYRIIRREELEEIKRECKDKQEIAKELLEWILQLEIPKIKCDYEYLSLQDPEGEYPTIGGRIVSNKGINISEEEFEDKIEEFQVPYSTSLRCRIKGRGTYVTGPIARFNNNYKALRGEVRDVLEAYGFKAPLVNTYQSIIARTAEIYHSTLEIERLIDEYREPEKPYVEGKVKAGWGCGASEAPRGILYHSYGINSEGYVEKARIIAPTTQNLAHIEQDILVQIPEIISKPIEEAQLRVEMIVRNYDPCISCSVHAIKVKIIKN